MDRDFAFGLSEWDLILLSWMPVNEPARLVDALRPGGIVVFEGPRAWFPRNGLLKTFDALRILHCEDVITEGDVFQGQKLPVLRFVAERSVELTAEEDVYVAHRRARADPRMFFCITVAPGAATPQQALSIGGTVSDPTGAESVARPSIS
jgi:hypothetical protein